MLTFTLAETPHFIVQFFMYSILFYMMFIGLSEPHTSLMQWRVDLFNEFMLLTQFYYFLLYMGLVLDPSTLYGVIGWTHIIHLGVLFTFNLFLNLTIIFKDLYWKGHLYKLKKEQKKNIIEREKERELERLRLQRE